VAGCAGAASASPSGLRGRTTLRSCSPPANPSLVSSAQERPAPSPAPRSDAPGAPQGSARRSAPQLSGDDAVALANDRADPQHPPPQNAPATCIRSDGSPRTAGISTQTIPRASAPSPQSASALPRHRSPSIPSARSSLPPVDLLPMSPVYSVTYLAGQDHRSALSHKGRGEELLPHPLLQPGHRNTLARQLIGALVFGVAGVALDPVPAHLMRFQRGVEPLP